MKIFVVELKYAQKKKHNLNLAKCLYNFLKMQFMICNRRSIREREKKREFLFVHSKLKGFKITIERVSVCKSILCGVNEGVHVGFVSFHVFVLDEPFDCFFNQFLRRQEHILKQLDQLRLQLSKSHTFTHFKYFNYSFLFFFFV